MADSSSDESGSENKLDEIFGESSDEEDFGGFVFEMPDDIEWEKDPSGAAYQSYYEDNPRVAFMHLSLEINACFLLNGHGNLYFIKRIILVNIFHLS